MVQVGVPKPKQSEPSSSAPPVKEGKRKATEPPVPEPSRKLTRRLAKSGAQSQPNTEVTIASFPSVSEALPTTSVPATTPVTEPPTASAPSVSIITTDAILITTDKVSSSTPSMSSYLPAFGHSHSPTSPLKPSATIISPSKSSSPKAITHTSTITSISEVQVLNSSPPHSPIKQDNPPVIPSSPPTSPMSEDNPPVISHVLPPSASVEFNRLMHNKLLTFDYPVPSIPQAPDYRIPKSFGLWRVPKVCNPLRNLTFHLFYKNPYKVINKPLPSPDWVFPIDHYPFFVRTLLRFHESRKVSIPPDFDYSSYIDFSHIGADGFYGRKLHGLLPADPLDAVGLKNKYGKYLGVLGLAWNQFFLAQNRFIQDAIIYITWTLYNDYHLRTHDFDEDDPFMMGRWKVADDFRAPLD